MAFVFDVVNLLNHPNIQLSEWYNSPDDPLVKFDVNINQLSLIKFLDAACANVLWKKISNTGLVYTFWGGAIVYLSKTQSLTSGSYKEAKFIAAHTAAKIARYVRIVLKQLGYDQIQPTVIHIDNISSLKIINFSHWMKLSYKICYFSIQNWEEDFDIIMKHIPGIIDPFYDLLKPFSYFLYECHCCRIIEN